MKDIPWYEWLYACTEDGRVWSHISCKFLKVKINRWYKYVILRLNWNSITHKVHRLIWITFIENIFNKPFINHINRNKWDNRVANLEWCTPKENNIHSWNNTRRVASEKQRNSARKNWMKCSKPVMQLTKEWILCKIYSSIRDASLKTWCKRQHIISCAKWKPLHKTCWGYLWKYS